jgi:hypothetical protein
MSYEVTCTTTSTYSEKYGRTIDDFIKCVREVPRESDAVGNIKILLREYDKRRTLWQRIRCVFI